MDTFLVSEQFSFIIPSGQTGANVAPVDLKKNYSGIIIACDDLAGVQVATDLTVRVGEKTNDTARRLYSVNNPASGLAYGMPTSGSYRVLCLDAFGARLVQLVLTKTVTSQKTFVVYGLDGASGS